MDQNNEIKTPRVSVIIPVYNTEAYVEEALRSIMNQTLKDIEIIVIDDGSTDNSLSVIKELAREDNRIEWFSQTNMGQSVARNLGLQKSTGKFVYFMDSDDILSDVALERCYNICVQNDLDFTFFDAEKITHTDVEHYGYNRQNKFQNQIYTGIDILNIMLKMNIYRVPPWLHFISRVFLIKENISFDPSFRFFEDQIFTTKLYLAAERVGYMPDFFFKRRIRTDSLMKQSYTIDKVKTYFKVADELLGLRDGLDKIKRDAIDRITFQMLSAAIYNANIFDFQKRWNLFWITLSKYPFYVSLKSYVVLLFPGSIQIKSIIKKQI